MLSVPNVRAQNLKQIIVMMQEDFIQDIDDNITALGFSNRAEFIRQAVHEKLAKAGVKIDAGKTTAPSRAGKGGRPRKITEFSESVAKVADDRDGPAHQSLPVKYPKKKGPMK
jgi:Arc/MetJ-type ribon-helix-helix transcriptional regulator